MTFTGRQLRDARFRAGLELGDLATRSGVDRDRLAYAEAMYGAPAGSGAKFGRVRYRRLAGLSREESLSVALEIVRPMLNPAAVEAKGTIRHALNWL